MIANETTAKMLERVRALLAKAESTTFPEEADAFRAKADELMTRYSIELWQVEMAQEGTQRRVVPEVRWFDWSWWNRKADLYRSALHEVFGDLAVHCRCRMVYAKQEWRDGSLRFPVVGLPQDLDYMDLLFTHLMLDLIKKVDPQPEPAREVVAEGYRLRMSGLDWMEITRRMIAVGMVEDPEPGASWRREGGWKHRHPERYRLSERIGGQVRRYAKENGLDERWPHVKTFRRNFADGYSTEVGRRLRAMRRDSEASYDADHAAGSMALAVRDIAEVVREQVYVIWPDLRPHPTDCECAECKERRKPVRTRRAPEYTYDPRAQDQGRDAGSRVALQNPAGARLRQRGELPAS